MDLSGVLSEVEGESYTDAVHTESRVGVSSLLWAIPLPGSQSRGLPTAPIPSQLPEESETAAFSLMFPGQ